MKNNADDVLLNDGEGYMVEWGPYRQHLDDSIETKQVCHGHHYTSCVSNHQCIRLLLVPTTRQLLKQI
jgi:hypothetical protein